MNPKDQIYIDSVQKQIDDGMYDHLFYFGYGDEKEEKEDLVFLDIGANIGLVSLYASQFCKHIVSIEPAPDTFFQLRHRTQLHPEIECVQLALSPVDEFVPFYVNDINFTASSTVNTYGKQIMVEGNRLSTILTKSRLDHVDVCKIDAEGAEGESLTHWELELCKDIIKTYYIETHNCPKTTWEHKLGTIVGNLARCGYSKMQIDGMAITATK